MANYSVNQNRQFYVAKSVGTVTEASTVGAVEVKSAGTALDKEIYLLVKGAETVLKSDRIPVKNVDYVKMVPAADMVQPLKKFKVALDATYLVDSKPIPGQDYILRIDFSQFYGQGNENTYIKEGMVHVTTGMTTATFYEKMAASLNLNFAREIGATSTSNPYLTFTYDSNGIYIQEKEQPWVLGTMKQRALMFNPVPTTIYVSGGDVVWGTVTNQTPAKGSAVVGTNAIGNGKKIADLEWFCMGERGDQYRGKGYPNVIPTKYLVDPTQQYDVVEIHFAFTDTGVNSYRSEKDITIVSAESGVAQDIYDQIIAILNGEDSGSSSNG